MRDGCAGTESGHCTYLGWRKGVGLRRISSRIGWTRKRQGGDTGERTVVIKHISPKSGNAKDKKDGEFEETE